MRSWRCSWSCPREPNYSNPVGTVAPPGRSLTELGVPAWPRPWSYGQLILRATVVQGLKGLTARCSQTSCRHRVPCSLPWRARCLHKALLLRRIRQAAPRHVRNGRRTCDDHHLASVSVVEAMFPFACKDMRSNLCDILQRVN